MNERFGNMSTSERMEKYKIEVQVRGEVYFPGKNLESSLFNTTGWGILNYQ